MAENQKRAGGFLGDAKNEIADRAPAPLELLQAEDEEVMLGGAADDLGGRIGATLDRDFGPAAHFVPGSPLGQLVRPAQFLIGDRRRKETDVMNFQLGFPLQAAQHARAQRAMAAAPAHRNENASGGLKTPGASRAQQDGVAWSIAEQFVETGIRALFANAAQAQQDGFAAMQTRNTQDFRPMIRGNGEQRLRFQPGGKRRGQSLALDHRHLPQADRRLMLDPFRGRLHDGEQEHTADMRRAHRVGHRHNGTDILGLIHRQQNERIAPAIFDQERIDPFGRGVENLGPSGKAKSVKTRA